MAKRYSNVRHFLACLIFTQLLVSMAICQAAKSNSDQAGERLAAKLATRIVDSLGLPTSAKERLFAVNLFLHNEKIRQMKSGADRAVIAVELQRIENKRDSLYREILPSDQFEWYRSRKRQLISNN